MNQRMIQKPMMNYPMMNHPMMNKPMMNQNNGNKLPYIYKQIYRDYYIQEFKSIYSILVMNHQENIKLNNQIYITSEMVRYGKLEYQVMLNHQEFWFNIQLNNMNYLIMNVWKLIDEIDKSCFPHIDFKYDYEFRNIYMLFELIQKIISNKIE